MLISLNTRTLTTQSAFLGMKLKGGVYVGICCMNLAPSFHFPELMMMKPIVGQPPSMPEPVLMLATPFKTGERTSQHAVCSIFPKPSVF